MPEKRYEKRKKKRLSVRFGPNGEKHFGYTCDISSEGFFLESKTVYKPGTVLNVEITTKNGALIHVTGKVCWAKKAPPRLAGVMKSGMGIKVDKFIAGKEVFLSFLDPIAASKCFELT